MSNYTVSDQDDLINYLESRPVSVKNSNNFSRSLTNGLRSLPTTVRPVSFAQNLATKLNSRSLKLNRPKTNYNLLSQKGLTSFYNSKAFKNSGVNKTRFSSVVNSSRSILKDFNYDSGISFPLSYKTTTHKETSPVINSDNKPNNIYNQSHVVRKGTGNNQRVVKGIKNGKIKDVYAGFSKPKTPNKTSVTPSNITPITPPTPVNTVPNNSFNQGNPRPNIPKPATPNKPPKSPEQERMDRIQQNYLNDKQNLVDQGRSLPTGQQMLAKSKNSDGGSSSSGGAKKSNNGGRAIKELTESLASEVKTDLSSNMM